MMAAMANHTVFFVSDGTGITAETFGNSILAQFEIRSRHVRRPFIDTTDKAHQVVREINHAADAEGRKPIVFVTLVDLEILSIVTTESKGLVLDMFNTFIEPLEYPGTVEVRMFLEAPGRSSIESCYELWKDGRKHAEGAAKIVWIDLNTQRSAPLPDRLRSPQP